jgi:hypothetical protein
MAKKVFCFLLLPFLCISLFVAQAVRAEDLTAEQLVAAHVKSIGNPALLAKITSNTLFGITDVDFIQGMNGSLKDGKTMIVSQGPKLAIVQKFTDINYPGEYFAYDGNNVTVGYMSPGQRSPLADFIFRFKGIMKEGMLGGIISNSWPLLNIQKKQADMKCRKTTIDGKELYELEYHPKEGFGLIKVRMYFDPTTFRHVRTDYRVNIKEDASVGNRGHIDSTADKATVNAVNPTGGMNIQARDDSHYTLTEKFDDFKKVGGLTLPHRYVLEYTLDGNGQAFLGHWTLTVSKWVCNAAIPDQKVFQAQK